METSALDIIRDIEGLVISGGGILGISHVGSIDRLCELGGLKKLKYVVGTSVGSIITGALGCGASTEFVNKTMFGLDIPSLKDGSCFLVNLIRFLRKGGLYKGEKLLEFAGNMLKTLTGNSEITFDEAYKKYKIHIIIPFFSCRYEATLYADYIRQPQMKIKNAIRASSNITGFFQAFKMEILCPDRELRYDLVMDGGISDNYPLHVLRELGVPASKIIGLRLFSVEDLAEYDAALYGKLYDHGIPKIPVDYLMSAINGLREGSMKIHVKENDWKLTVKTNIGKHKVTEFDIDDKGINELYEEGINAVDRHLEDIQTLIDEGNFL